MSASEISQGVREIVGSLDGWTDLELSVLATGIVLEQKRREPKREPDPVAETNQLLACQHTRDAADYFEDCEGTRVDRTA